MRIVLFFLFLNNFSCFCQFIDDFSDSDFTNNPTWDGENSKFIVNGANELQLSAPAVTDDAYLSTSSQAIENASWEFSVRLEFNPSSSNYCQVYLVSNSTDLKNPLNGYYVYIGGTNDEISLYRQDGTQNTKILAGVSGSVNSAIVDVFIRVSRDDEGNWELERDTIDGGATYISEGTVFDNTHFQSFYFGVYCDYTSTRSDKFFFDNFTVTGDPYNDTIPPGIENVSVISSTELDLYFSEVMDQTSVENTANYTVNNGIGTPSMASLDGTNQSLVHLTFGNAFQDGVINNITINNVQDLSSNIANELNRAFYYYIPGTPEIGDVRINEIMFKETPSAGQPLVEYVELYNVSEKSFEVDGWKIYNDNSGGTIQNTVLLPGTYLVVHPTNGLDSFPNVSNINATSFPGLKNDGDHIFIYNADESVLLDDFAYLPSMLRDEEKENGGYSLEMINPSAPCNDEDNWKATEDPSGGTPGLQNSVFSTDPVTTNPVVNDFNVFDSSYLVVYFSASMDSVNFSSASIQFNPTINWSWEFSENRKTVRFNFPEGLEPGVFYELSIGNGATDCYGNALLDGHIEFALPVPADFNDIVINEVLFNPNTGSREFVEIYNRSEKVIRIQNWKLANMDDDTIANEKVITPDPVILFPGEYKVMTRDTLAVQNDYMGAVKGTFIEMESLPSYTNTEGTVYLLNSLNEVIDKFSYHEDMHFPVIQDKKGKSLERISPDRPTDDETNWQTAAETVGFATPGYRNSQRFDANYTGTVSIEPEIFSPDNDGTDDVLNINYTFETSGNVANIEIYDAAGRLIRNLKNNEYLGVQGSYSWDGSTEKGEKARIGHYLVFFQVYTLEGNTEVYKVPCVLATRF